MNIRIDGKSVFITGGTGSLGIALIDIFSRNGGQVTFQFHSNSERARQLDKEFGAKGIRMDFRRDCRLPRSDFDILINNAGINISSRLSHEVTTEDWEHTLSVNLTASYQLIRQCLPHMVEQRWGRIINISSIYALRGSTANLPYNASKHGLSGVMKTVAKEYGSEGIRCNEICPGPVESELMNRIAEQKEQQLGISRDEYFRSIREAIPIRRLATPQEIAQLALYLASDQADSINGASIAIDGGLTT